MRKNNNVDYKSMAKSLHTTEGDEIILVGT